MCLVSKATPDSFGASLRGHDDGASGDDEGVESTSTQLWKRGRFALSGHAVFSGFEGVDNEFACENRNCVDGSCLHQHVLCCLVLRSGLSAADFIISDEFLWYLNN